MIPQGADRVSVTGRSVNPRHLQRVAEGVLGGLGDGLGDGLGFRNGIRLRRPEPGRRGGQPGLSSPCAETVPLAEVGGGDSELCVSLRDRGDREGHPAAAAEAAPFRGVRSPRVEIQHLPLVAIAHGARFTVDSLWSADDYGALQLAEVTLGFLVRDRLPALAALSATVLHHEPKRFPRLESFQEEVGARLADPGRNVGLGDVEARRPISVGAFCLLGALTRGLREEPCAACKLNTPPMNRSNCDSYGSVFRRVGGQPLRGRFILATSVESRESHQALHRQLRSKQRHMCLAQSKSHRLAHGLTVAVERVYEGTSPNHVGAHVIAFVGASPAWLSPVYRPATTHKPLFPGTEPEDLLRCAQSLRQTGPGAGAAVRCRGLGWRRFPR